MSKLRAWVIHEMLETPDYNERVGLVCDIDADDWIVIVEPNLKGAEAHAKRKIAEQQRLLDKIGELRAIRLALDISERGKWLNEPGSYLARALEEGEPNEIANTYLTS